MARAERQAKHRGADRLFERYVDPFLDHLRAERGLSDHTVAAYRSDLGRYVEHLARRGIERPGDGDRSTIEAHVRALRRAGRAPSSVSRALSAVRTFHRFLSNEGLATDNPALGVASGKRWQRVPRTLSIEEIERLLGAPRGTDARALRDRALLEMAYATGLRASELVGLAFGSILRDDRFVRVVGKGGRERLVPFGEHAADALDRYLTSGRPDLASRRRSETVFLNHRGGPLTRVGWWTILKRHARAVNLEKRVHPHVLRHAFATHLLAGGADLRLVQELLGHASIATTEIYTHVDRSHLIETHRACHPRG